MKVKRKQSGITLTEMTVVIVTIALLVGIGLPAIRAFMRSFESRSGAKSMISSALASVRAMAIKEGRYAGIRFQKVPNGSDVLGASQYMIFIVNDTNVMAYGFRVIEGVKPIKLPDSVGVMDLRRRTKANPQYSGDEVIDSYDKIDEPEELTDTTSFSVIFTKTGKLVIHEVRVRNRQGAIDGSSNDAVFNTKNNVDNGIGMFYQDDYSALGLGKEHSRNHFVVYEKIELKEALKNAAAWSDYLRKLEPIYINAYTGTLISTD